MLSFAGSAVAVVITVTTKRRGIRAPIASEMPSCPHCTTYRDNITLGTQSI